jgi:hypothetical protein
MAAYMPNDGMYAPAGRPTASPRGCVEKRERTADRNGGGLRYGGAHYILAPEHGQLLIWRGELAISRQPWPEIMQKLWERTATDNRGRLCYDAGFS